MEGSPKNDWNSHYYTIVVFGLIVIAVLTYNLNRTR